MRNKNSGFTLIELVVVIALLGILAAVAFPRYIDLTTDASLAATQGVAGSLASASAINYSARKLNPVYGAAVTNCTSGGSLLSGGALPAGYVITAAAVAADVNVTCTLTGPKATAATFIITGIP